MTNATATPVEDAGGKTAPSKATDLTQNARVSYNLQRRLYQKLSLFYIMFNIVGPFWWWPFSLAVMAANPLSIGRWLMVAYIMHIFVTGKNAHMQPKGSAPIKRLKFWKHLADYFPARLVKTADLDPSQHYMFCGHPHGIACFSYTSNFFIEATGFSDHFPGITLYPVLLEQHFFTPIHREVCLWAGFRGNSKDALVSLLQGPPGSSVFLIPGGAPEALKSHPGTNELILKRRKGFIKIALQTGAQLVPVVGFGETSLFDVSQPAPGSLVHRVQQLVMRLTGFAFPTISGAGFWSGTGPLPKPLPLTTVVGKPLKVPKWEGSTSDPAFRAAVDEYHALYCEAVKKLWDDNKAAYAPPGSKDLELVE